MVAHRGQGATMTAMPLFKLSAKTLKNVKTQSLRNERELQNLVEENLKTVFSLDFVVSEFAPQGDLRIDSLAFDSEQMSFVIIEYKKGSSWSVVDQGFAYLALMLNHKADFVLKINECCKKTFGIKDINWEASRVIFIAPTFNAYQKEALGFQDLPIELWEVEKYEGDLIAFKQIQGHKRNAKLSDVQSGSSADVQKVKREIRTFTVDYHFKEGKWMESRDLYDELSAAILVLDSRLQVRPVKQYIGLHIDGKNIFALHIYKSKIELHFSRTQPKDLNDPQKLVKYFKNSKKYFNQHVSKLTVNSSEDIPYAAMLAKQALKRIDK